MLNHKTIGTYIQYLCNVFLFYKVRRYDIQGKRYLESQDKYYLVDPTFEYVKLGRKNITKPQGDRGFWHKKELLQFSL